MIVIKGMDAIGWMDLVLSRSAELRKAGVLELGAEGCTVLLAPPEPAVVAPPSGNQKTEEETPRAALYDEASYADGVVPGFEIDELEEP